MEHTMVPAVLGGPLTNAAQIQELEGMATMHGGGLGMGSYELGAQAMQRFQLYMHLQSALNDPIEPLLAGLKL